MGSAFSESEAEKLAQTLSDNLNYFLLHHLKLYVRLDLIYRNVQRFSKFNYSCWLEPDIELNTLKGREITNQVQIKILQTHSRFLMETLHQFPV